MISYDFYSFKVKLKKPIISHVISKDNPFSQRVLRSVCGCLLISNAISVLFGFPPYLKPFHFLGAKV